MDRFASLTSFVSICASSYAAVSPGPAGACCTDKTSQSDAHRHAADTAALRPTATPRLAAPRQHTSEGPVGRPLACAAPSPHAPSASGIVISHRPHHSHRLASPSPIFTAAYYVWRSAMGSAWPRPTGRIPAASADWFHAGTTHRLPATTTATAAIPTTSPTATAVYGTTAHWHDDGRTGYQQRLRALTRHAGARR